MSLFTHPALMAKFLRAKSINWRPFSYLCINLSYLTLDGFTSHMNSKIFLLTFKLKSALGEGKHINLYTNIEIMWLFTTAILPNRVRVLAFQLWIITSSFLTKSDILICTNRSVSAKIFILKMFVSLTHCTCCCKSSLWWSYIFHLQIISKLPPCFSYLGLWFLEYVHVV